MIGLLCEASGMTAAEVVERFQYTACTHCFPEAPVESRTLSEQGFCEHSGAYVPEERIAELRHPEWWRMAVAPTVRCECGWAGAITKSGKYRKHKAGG